jgi:hypothetical protein
MSAPMCVNSGSYGLKHSRYNPEYGMSAEAPRQKSEETASEQRDRQLKTLKINFFNLIAARNTEKALKTAAVFIKAAEKRVSALECRMNNTSRNKDSKENSDKNIIKVIQFEVKAAVQTAVRKTSLSPTSSTISRS